MKLRSLLPVLAVLLLAGCAISMPSGAPTLTAGAVADRLMGAGLIADPVASDAASDPNKLLGRPGQYSARVTFTVAGLDRDFPVDDPQACDRGGCVEQWPDQAAAQRRADYIAELGKGVSVFAEYNYVRADGLLLRVSGAATPDQAAAIGDAFVGL